MSGLRNAVYRRNHPERSQPASRSRFGLLEKHKDYVQRARDYDKKKASLKILKEKASLKNPDEFYFAMSRNQTRGGIHFIERDSRLPEDVVRLIKDQHLNYINIHEGINRKKLEELKTSLQVTRAISGDSCAALDSNSNISVPRGKHIVFLDTNEENSEDAVPEQPAHIKEELLSDTVDPKSFDKLKQSLVREFEERLTRQKKLNSTQKEYQLRKNLQSKGPRIIIGKDQNGLRTYKWKQYRKG